MSAWWRWVARIRDLVFRRRLDRESVEEIRFHIEMEARALQASGLDEEEALRQARLRFGGEDRFREEVARTRFLSGADDFLRDLRHSARALTRVPGYTTAVLLTLALGVGATTAIFSAVQAVLLRPLPYVGADHVYRVDTRYNGDRGRISPAEYLDFATRMDDVSTAVGVYSFGTLTRTGDGPPELLRTAFVTSGYFPALGIEPVVGRSFSQEEDEAGEALVLVSESYWRTRLGADPEAVGRTLTMSGTERRLIGVVPDRTPPPEDLLSGQTTHVYAPHGIVPSAVTNRGSHYLLGVARAREGLTPAVVGDAYAASGRWMVDTYPDGYPQGMDFSVQAVPLANDVRGPLRTPLLILSAAVGFLLLIAGANVANLMLARSDRRRREFSVRAALGAGRTRLARQALAESLLLGLSGGLVGVLLAAGALRFVIARAGADLPWLADAGLHGPVLLFSLALSVLTGVLVGLIPALQASGGDPNAVLNDVTRGSTSGARTGRVGRALIVGQLAVSLSLLTAGGLMLNSLTSLLRVDPGFETRDITTTRVSLPTSVYPDNAARVQFFAQLVPRLEQIPGVRRAAGVTNLPLATSLGDLNFEIEGRPIPDDQVSPRADWQVVTPGYFEAMGVEVVRGRGIDGTDVEDAPGAVVVNERLVQEHWPGEDPIGRRFLLGGEAGPGWVSVVGVVRDVRHTGLDQTSAPAQMYLSHAQFRFWGSGAAVSSLAIVLATEGGPQDPEAAVRTALAELDPNLPLPALRPMTEVRRASLALPRILTALIGAFAAVALLLAAVGLYGVVAYSVGKRRREFGIRSALGAGQGRVLRDVVAEGLPLLALGLVLGAAGSLLVGRAMAGVRYDAAGGAAGTLAVVAVVLAFTSLVALVLPARRATRVSPVIALRSD